MAYALASSQGVATRIYRHQNGDQGGGKASSGQGKVPGSDLAGKGITDRMGERQAPAYEGRRVYIPSQGDLLGDMSDATAALGGKGAKLADMVLKGMPVPPVATIPTTECERYAEGRGVDDGLWAEVREAVKVLEQRSGKSFFEFAEGQELMLVSVRSGAKMSMPGMMETVLNIGLNDERVERWRESEDERFVNDTYRRFIQYYGSVVLGIDSERFEKVLSRVKEKAGVKDDHELSAAQLRKAIAGYKRVLKNEGQHIPADPFEQLKGAVEAVFASSFAEKAMRYKQENNLPEEMATAVTIQIMVYGNRNENSGSGVLFTRNKSTGEAGIHGEYLVNAQGEEVVAGIRTAADLEGFSRMMPGLAEQLFGYAQELERAYRDMQDMEFTVENGKLFVLQTRDGKRGGQAAFKIAHDLVQAEWITKEEAVGRITEDHVRHVLLPRLDPNQTLNPHAKGIPASSGTGCGVVVFSSKEAERLRAQDPKKPIILLRKSTSTDDFGGMIAAGRSSGGVLTAEGGSTSHAAVVCGGNGIPAVVGCSAIQVDARRRTATIDGKTVKKGDWLTIDGTSGEVYLGKMKLIPPELRGEAIEVLGWADEMAEMGVLANADTPEEAKKARELGARGIGLCRTEHMFREGDRLKMVQGMIMARTEGERRKSLEPLLELQRSDFEGIFHAMSGLPVTIRLIDPPLHEFLPSSVELGRRGRGALLTLNLRRYGQTNALRKRALELHEENPMMGNRGVRLSLMYPEIMEMQARAIIEAAANVKAQGGEPVVKIMVPLVALSSELREARRVIDGVAQQVMEEKGVKVEYKVGTMIELPRAALEAGAIAEHADFFSFGTNDLTQMTFGFSRDDMGDVTANYIENGLLPADPFKHLDPRVAELVEIAVARGREANPDLDIGICGEHGGDMRSIKERIEPIRRKLGFDTVSCSTFKVPIARMAVAQAALRPPIM